MRLLISAAMLGCLAVHGFAGDFTVSKSGPADFDTVTSAILACDLTSDTDTITILDSSIYREDFPFLTGASNGGVLENITTLTLTSAAGQTPVLEKTSGAGQVIRYNPELGSTMTLTLTIGGDSPEAPLTLRNAATTAPCLNVGGGILRDNRIVARNLILDRPTTQGGTLLVLNNAANHVLTQVHTTGRATTDSSTIVALSLADDRVATFTDCGFRASGSGRALTFTVLDAEHDSGRYVFENCVVRPSTTSLAIAPGVAPYISEPAFAGRVEFNDCDFQVGNAPAAGFSRGFQIGGRETVVLNRPTLIGGMGDIAFWVPSSATSPTLEIRGEAGNLADVGGVAALPVRMLSGTFIGDYIEMTTQTAIGASLLDSAFEGPLAGAIDVRISNSSFTNGTGFIGIVALNGVAGPVVSNYPVSLVVRDSVYDGIPDPIQTGVYFGIQDTSRTQPSTLVLENVTLNGKSAGVIWHANTIDTVLIDGCDFIANETPNLDIDYTGTIANTRLTGFLNSMGPLPTTNLTFDNVAFEGIGDILFRMYYGGRMTFRNCDFDDNVARIAQFGRCSKGNLTYEACTFDGFNPVNNDTFDGQPLRDEGCSVTLRRCFLDGAVVQLSPVAASEYAGGSIKFTAENTIFRANPATGWTINTNSFNTLSGLVSDPTTSTLVLNHCTFYENTQNIYINTEAPTDPGLVGVDTIETNYCIYDMQGGQPAISGNTAPTGVLNVITRGTFASGGFAAGELPDTIFENPLLAQDGRLTGGGPAVDAAIGSTLTIDIDGDPRPFGTVNDIGADEVFIPNAARHWEYLR